MYCMSGIGLFDPFLTNLLPTEDQTARVLARQTAVCQALHSHYYATPFDGGTALTVDSYRKQTTVRNHVDIDLLFRMPYRMHKLYESVVELGPQRLIHDVCASLGKAVPASILRPDGQAIVVPFDSFAVQILPVFGLGCGKYLLPDLRTRCSWKTIHPDSEDRWLCDSDARTGGATRQLIRMSKAWKYACGVPIKSLALELLAIEFLNKWRHRDRRLQSLDRLFAEFLEYLTCAAGGFAFVPGTRELVLYGTAWKRHAEIALRHAAKAGRMSARAAPHPAADTEWRQVFGILFAG
jgi:hypothetical protein